LIKNVRPTDSSSNSQDCTLGDSIYALSGQPDKLRVDVFTLDDSSWKRLSDLPDANFSYSALVVHNNTLYRFGGGGSISAVSRAHVYQRNQDKWIGITSLDDDVHAPAAAVLGDSIYITGGYSNSKYSNKCVVYDVNTGKYGRGPSLLTGCSYHSMVRIGDCIYSVGGHNNQDDASTSLIRHCMT
jgi:N-acetylneuraminic acid mutarotase